ncbi:MAG: bifunctional DNA-formamidopyrimidine glycosylase/DNA-(apurinic or apyrimidinic site) lyase [Kiritimatiellia bacterium]
MPELPEIETVIRDMKNRGIRGCSISSVYTGWPAIISDRTPDSFSQFLRQSIIEDVTRRGKYIIMHLSGSKRMLIHLRMTGKLFFQPENYKPGKHDHVVFSLSDRRKLVFNDTRKFGRITLFSKDEDSPISKLGPEPLNREFTASQLASSLKTRSRQIKPLLLDQSFIAGLGNIYTDEALWDARIHPERLSKSIAPDEAEALYKGIRTVLQRGIKNCGTTLGKGRTNFYSVAGRRGRNADELRVFRREGEPCPACGTPIKRILVGQRGTHFCPNCQRL